MSEFANIFQSLSSEEAGKRMELGVREMEGKVRGFPHWMGVKHEWIGFILERILAQQLCDDLRRAENE